MRLIYLDPGLRDNLGHHANSCRQIAGEARRRGLGCHVLGHVSVEAGLREELGVLPAFNWYTYAAPHGAKDRLAGWLRDFEQGVETTLQDLRRVDGIAASDVVYVNSAQTIQFAAIVRWLAGRPPGQRPTTVLEFGVEPGVATKIEQGQRRYVPADPRVDPRATLYRFGSYSWPAGPGSLPLTCATFDTGASDAYRALIDRPVVTLPLPRLAMTDRRNRAGVRPITIGVLGHQRPDKGYHLMPEIVRRVLDARPDVRFLLHNGAPRQMASVQEALRQVAQADERVLLDDRTADQEIWAGLLERCDLILCPYEPDRFRTSYSAVVSEAIAEGIPTVVPDNTSLSSLVASFDWPGMAFDGFDAPSIAQTVCAAIDGFDTLAERAHTAAVRWPQVHGPKRLVDDILAQAESARMTGTAIAS